MKLPKILVILSFGLLLHAASAQQTAVFTNQYVAYEQALSLYDNNQFAAAQQQFEKVKLTTEDGTVEANCAYYIANCAVRLNQQGADDLMQDFVDRYPTSTKRNSAFSDVANYYFENGQYSRARKWYDQVNQSNLSNSEKEKFNFNYGYTLFQNKRFDDAKSYMNKVRDSKEYGAQAKYYLGFMAYEGDDYQEADELFEEVKGNDRYEKNLSYFQADMNFKLGKFEKAVAEGKAQLAKSNPKEKSQLNKIIGESYFNLGNYAEAVPYLKEYRGTRGKWNNTDYYQLGYAYYKQGEFDNAISEFNKIVDGKNAVAQNAYYHLAESYLKLDQKQQALNAFKNASEMEFDNAIKKDALLNYAKLSYEIGNSYESTPKVLTRYLETYPVTAEKTELQNLLIDSYITSKNYAEAMELLESSRDFDNKVAYQKVAFYRGIELYNEDNYTEAKTYFEKSLSEPRDASFTARATYWNAETDYNLNNFQDALIGYKEFQGMSAASQTEAYKNLDYNLGYAYFKQKDYEQAISYFKKYSETSSDTSRKKDAFLRLGDTYFVTSKYWPAMESYNDAIALGGKSADYAAFQKAISYGFVNKNDRKIEDLTSFLNQFSRSTYRDDALYELGNTYVAIGNTQEGIKAYNRLIRDVPKSSYVSKALLKQGLIYYNSDRGNEALEKFKKVAADFPGTAQADQAVKTARLIYVDLGRTSEYANWVKTLDFVNVTDADLDNTTYEAAEQQYRQENANAALRGFENYLEEFPNGLHALQSHFYLAQLQFKDNKKEESISHYKFVLTKERNEFTEQSLAQLSQIYLEKSNYKDAIPVLKRLETEADFPQNIVFAQSNLMKSYYKQDNYEQAVSYAENVLANSSIDTKVKNDAHIIIARSAMKTGDEAKAKTAYATVQKTATGKLAAEALYYDAYFKNKAGNYKASNESVQTLAKEYSGYKEYSVKSLLVMAKNFYALEDAYQATYILENIINNFTDYPTVVDEAKAELIKIKTEEAKTNADVNTNGN